VVFFKGKKFYITSAIPYVNAPPHIGHALEIIQADCIARFQKLVGEDVFFLAGTDENAQKNVLSAEKLGLDIKQLVDQNVAKFKTMVNMLNTSNDDFIRTSDKKRHWPGVEKLWNLAFKKGDIYEKSYKGYYCVGCEAFVTEKDLVDGVCPEHQKPPEEISEVNYFFKLSKYQKQLEKIIESDEYKIVPESRKNEVLSFIRSGLEDFSISRPAKRMKNWGVPVPGDKSQIIYVWFDALANYITALGFGTKDESKFEKLWPADVHVIGKGIIRFHAIYWPAMLLSAGLPLPKVLFVHNYITVEGRKMSKSLGNVINPKDIVNKFGSDAVRYFMLREIPPFSDGDFSQKALVRRFNTELVANYSNLYYRITSFIEKNFSGKYVEYDPGEDEEKLEKLFLKKVEKYKELMGEFRLNEALSVVMELSSHLNKYFQDKKPWVTLASDELECKRTLAFSVKLLNIISTLFYPFIPAAAERALVNFELEPTIKNVDAKLRYRPNIKGIMLFKKIDIKGKHKVEKNQEVEDLIPFKDFKKMEFRTGTVLEANEVPESNKLIKMQVDFGEFKRQVVAGLKEFYKAKDLVGKQYIFITNLEHANLMGNMSEAMILAAVEGDDENVVLVKAEKKVPNGTPIC
jgi:methionyl-tRNA synthetase